MSKNLKIFIVIAILIIVVSAGLIIFAGSKSKKSDQSNSGENGNVAGVSTSDSASDTTTENADYIVKLAKYLSEKGMVMYGAYWCSHCKEQKDTFGDAFQYIDYVECDPQGSNANPDECQAQGIEGYPTWIYQGQKYSGTQTLAKLAQIVGFTDDTAAPSSTDQTTP